jgi:LysR family transcriptional regulator, hydrogen peroxide-inducible genes activator
MGEAAAVEMHQIRYFLALCEELNFTRAAEKCHVTQPSLTRAIKLLEEELGGALFHRERAHTHLSELGRVMKPFLEEAYRQSQQAREVAASFVKLDHTPLKLGIMCTIGPANLVGLISTLHESYPGVELQIVDAAASTLQQRLIDGELEAAIYCLPGEADERLHALPLFREPFVIALNARHPLARKNAVAVRDLDGERYVNRASCEVLDHARAIFLQHGAKIDRIYRSERDDWILAMVAAGLGFGFLPQYCVVERGDVIVRPLVQPEIWREVSLFTVRGRPHSPAVGALVREAMRFKWMGREPLAVQRAREGEAPDANGGTRRVL